MSAGASWGTGKLLQGRQARYSFFFLPEIHLFCFFSHYESSSCLLFKKYIRKPQLRKTKADMVPIPLCRPETNTVSMMAYILPDSSL